MTEPQDKMEIFIRETFENNYAHIKQETGNTLSPYAKEMALNQVIMYWRKLRSLAESITQTEVKLNLPGQQTPKGRIFNIDGVVDILREREKVTMYDIKTHDPDYIRNNPDVFSDQMNVYAHIWQKLQGQKLDEMVLIATTLPMELRHAIARNDEKGITEAMAKWIPEVPVEFSDDSVKKTIRRFGDIVDKIECSTFGAPPPETLRTPLGHKDKPFAVQVCKECDARFSCVSYRKYQGLKRGEKGLAVAFYGDHGTTEVQNERLNAVVNEES